MPMVNLAIVPELMQGERSQQYRSMAEGITSAIVDSTGAPAESVHVLITEVADERYAVGRTMLAEAIRGGPDEASRS